MTLYIACIDLSEAFDLVSQSGLSELLRKIGCSPHLLAIITSLHEDMHSRVCFNGVTSEAFPVSSGVKQGCVHTFQYPFLHTPPVRLQGLQ